MPAKKVKNPTKRTLESRKHDAKHPERKKERAARNRARRAAEKAGKVRKGDGKDIDHKKPLRNGGSNSSSNTRVRDASKNRADNGGKGGRPKGAKTKRKASSRTSKAKK